MKQLLKLSVLTKMENREKVSKRNTVKEQSILLAKKSLEKVEVKI